MRSEMLFGLLALGALAQSHDPRDGSAGFLLFLIFFFRDDAAMLFLSGSTPVIH
jgi:hypothetical protein